MLTHDKPCVTGHFCLVHRDDRLCAREFFLVVIGEMAMGQFPVTKSERAGYELRGCRSLYFLHNDPEHSAISASDFSQILLGFTR